MSAPPQSNSDDQQEDETDQITVYINNLPLSTTEDDVRALCEKYGEVLHVCNRINKMTNNFSGNTFVAFKHKEDGLKAIDALNNSTYKERTIVVERAKREFEKDYKGKTRNREQRRPRDDRGGYYGGYREHRSRYDRPPPRYDNYPMPPPPPGYSKRYEDDYYRRERYDPYPEYQRARPRYDRRDYEDEEYRRRSRRPHPGYGRPRDYSPSE